MLKKNRVLLISVILLAILAVILYLSNSTNTFSKNDSNFAITDSSTVTRIFLTDKENNKVELRKEGKGNWIVNNKYKASNDQINFLLKTMISLDAKTKVPKTEQDNVIRRMAAIGIKVEIYQTAYRIHISDKLKWFPYEKLSLVYYVGDATKDNLGTYMLIQNAKHPYIVQIKGFNGFLFTRYSTNEDDWKDHSIFNYRLTEIKTVTLEMPDAPDKSWTLENLDNRNFKLYSLKDNKEIQNIDTLRVMEYLGSFANVKFEIFLNNMQSEIKDSIINSTPWHILTITDINGKQTTIKTYRKKANPGETDMAGNTVLWDRDRLYALVNDGKDFVMIQFFIFDRILRSIDYFIKK